MKEHIKERISQSLLDRVGIAPDDIPDFSIEVPRETTHGDFATNVAMMLAGKLKRAPREVAADLTGDLEGLDFVARTEIAGPGFINLFIRPEAWHAVARRVLAQGADFGRSRSEHAEKVLIEFVSANPTGPLHFGHGRGAVVGDVLAKLLDFAGYEVGREYYVNDAGAQVRALAESVVYKLREKNGLAGEFPADGYHGDYVAGLAESLPAELTAFLPGQPGEKDLLRIQDFAVEAMLQDIKRDLASFGVNIDHYASERSLVEQGRVTDVLDELGRRGLLEDREGARWFASDRFGDEKPRVLVKKGGDNTYFATDIAYHHDKLQRGYERLINVWGADHHGYVARMKASLQALGNSADVLEVVLVQMVSLLRGGEPVVMSKRKGEITTLREVVDEVGKDAARFFFLLRNTDAQMEFDLELAKKRSLDNPVFYVQYGHARLSNILARARERGIEVPDPDAADSVDLSRLTLDEELAMLKKMDSFTETVARAAENRTPHLVVFCLQEMVADFHHYYTAYARKSPILKVDPDLVQARLILVQALRTVLRNALALLGVSAPDRMESLPEDVQ